MSFGRRRRPSGPTMHPINVALAQKMNLQQQRLGRSSIVLAGEGICFICGKTMPEGTRGVWHSKFGAFHSQCAERPGGAGNGGGSGTSDVSKADLKLYADQAVKAATESSIREVHNVARDVHDRFDAALSSTNAKIADAIKVVDEKLAANVTSFQTRAVKMIEEEVAKRVKPRELQVRQYKATPVTIAHPHMMFEKLVYLIGRKQHCYLWGPPGSGKSTAAYHVSKALGIRFAYISLTKTSMESKLFGFMQPQMQGDAKFVDTDLFKCYTKGGVYCIDEMDNGPANLLASLNTLLEMLEEGSFPCGMVPRSKNFIVVGTGNTTGFGADTNFHERQKFDIAFAARFAYLQWGYDEVQERAVALEHNPASAPWIDWFQAARAWGLVNDPKLVISPRETYKFVQLLPDKVFTPAELLRVVVWKGVEQPRVERLLNAVPLPEVV